MTVFRGVDAEAAPSICSDTHFDSVYPVPTATWASIGRSVDFQHLALLWGVGQTPILLV